MREFIKRRKILVLVFVLLQHSLSAQINRSGLGKDPTGTGRSVSKSKIQDNIGIQQSRISEDQVFLQTDRNRYLPGDTVYFQSYIRDRFTGSFESASSAMYVLLYNEQNQLADSARFRIINATSPGWLAIPANAKPGIYHMVAFTTMMQNFDPSDAFHLDLSVAMPENQSMIIELRLNKEKYQPGDTLEAYLQIMDIAGNPVDQQNYRYGIACDNYLVNSDKSRTNKDGESFIRYIIPDSILFISNLQIRLYNSRDEKIQTKNFNIPFINDFPYLKFLPEGGNLIKGVQQVIGFNAVNRHGVPVEIEGLLKNIDGVILDTIKSGPYGPGKFTCVAENGMYAELIKGAGEKKKWLLPVPDSSGFCLSIKPVGKRSFAIEVQSDKYDGDTVFLSGMMNMQQIIERKFALNQKQRIVIKTDDLPSGIAVITLFDKDERPIAERLVAVNTDERLKFSVKTDQGEYNPGQESQLEVNVADQDGKPVKGIFSISVADSASGYDSELFLPGIEYIFNYNPFFPHNLPPKVLEKGLQNLTDEQLDLMLMTYGWCKFTNDIQQEAIYKELTDYDQLKMKLTFASKSHPAEAKLDLISLEGPKVIHLKTGRTGEVSLPLDSLPAISRSVTLVPRENGKNRISGAMLSIPYNEQFLKDKSLFTSWQYGNPWMTSAIVKNGWPHDKGAIPGIKKPGITDKTFELPEVSISAPRKIEYANKHEELYKYANVKSLTLEHISKYSTLGQAIRNIVPTATIIEPPLPPAIYFRQTHSFFGGRIPVLLVLDDMPVYEGWAAIRTFPTDQISSISVLDGPQGYIIYGEIGSGGVIFINSIKSGIANVRTDWISQNRNNNLLTPIYLFRQNVEFYNPARSDTMENPALKDRTTIYWNPEVYFDGISPVKIKYLNPMRNTKMQIVINGVSLDNLSGTGKGSYAVGIEK